VGNHRLFSLLFVTFISALPRRSISAILAAVHGFTNTPQEYPPLRSAEERRDDFHEIYQPYADAAAQIQASRCSQCGIPFCQVHCPLENNIPDWLRLTAEGRLDEAYAVSSATNTFPEICGRICPQDRLCEGNCVVNKDFNAITIGSIEKYITDHAWDNGLVQPFKPAVELKQSVGIVGAGPAGLAAAEQLRRRGYQVHVYDRHDRVGGLLIYGIPNFKLDKSIVTRRTQQFEQSGIRFHLNCEIGKDVTLEELRAKHDAVLMATGVYQARDITMPGIALDGVTQALPFLIAHNRHGLGDATDAALRDVAGKNVVVIGGGDTAMDCLRTSVRAGAKSVTCLYRRDRENMPGSAREVKRAEEEGVQFKWLSAPKALDGDGRVQRVLAKQMRLGEADASGRRMPEEISGSEFELAADRVILALGFEAETVEGAKYKCRDDRRILIDARFETSQEGVFAAGDNVRGASLVVWAIRDGRDAAAAMHRFLQNTQKDAA
jgi:glutamate synthase (NADPH/NADH) small chain